MQQLAHSPNIIASALRRLSQTLDRAIRRLEDRYRGELPYMRDRSGEDTAPPPLTETLETGAAPAGDAALAGLRATLSAGNEGSVAAADGLKPLADEAASLAMAYLALRAETEGHAPSTPGEPIWAGGLTARLCAFAATARDHSSSAAEWAQSREPGLFPKLSDR